MQARYPKLAEMFNGREDLAERVRSFWDDGSEEMCFTEMQVLAHHGGAICATDPEALWQAIEAAVATVPLGTRHAVGVPRGARRRRRALPPAQGVARARCGRTSTSCKEVWAPVNDMWQQSLPLIEEAGRHVVAQYERGQSLESLIAPGCDILDEPHARDHEPASRRGCRSSSCPASSSARACTSSSPASW